VKGRSTTTIRPFLCDDCGADRYEISHGRAEHKPGCVRKQRSLAYNDDLRARLDRATALANSERAANAARKGITDMSTTQALAIQERDDRLAAMTSKELVAEAKSLNIKGYSKLTKKGDLIAAIVEATPLPAKKSGGRKSTKPKATPRPITDWNVGDKVQMVSQLTLSMRTEGYTGTIEADTKGTIVELKRVGPGVQATVDFDGITEPVALGVRWLAVIA